MKMADEVMSEMLRTFEERGKTYGNNYLIIGDVLASLFPQGMILASARDFNVFHLYMCVLIKATRLANAGLRHQDSAHDMAVYSAMLAGLLDEGDAL